MLLRHLLGYMPAHFMKALVAFAAVFVFTRLLEPAEFGRYALALSTTAFCGTVFQAWLEAALARRYAAAEARGETRAELATAFAGYAVMCAVVSGVVILTLIVAPLQADIKLIAGVGAAKFAAEGFIQLLLIAHRSARHVARTVMLDTTRTILGFAFGVAFVLVTDLRAAGPLAGILVGSLAAILIDMPWLFANLRGGAIEPNRLRTALTYGVAVSITLALEQMLSVADRFLIAAFLGEAETGVYAAGYSIGNRFLDVVFVWAIFAAEPLTVSAVELEGDASARDIARRFIEVLLGLLMPAALGVALVAEPLATAMIGEDFRAGAIPIIPWIAGAALLSGVMTHYLRQPFIIRQRSGQMAAAIVAPAVSNIALNIWLIPQHGVMGAVAATVIAYAIGVSVFIVWGRRIFPLPMPWRTFFLATCGCALMAPAVIVTPAAPFALATLALKAGVGVLVYGGFAIATNLGGCRDLVQEFRESARPAH